MLSWAAGPARDGRRLGAALVRRRARRRPASPRTGHADDPCRRASSRCWSSAALLRHPGRAPAAALRRTTCGRASTSATATCRQHQRPAEPTATRPASARSTRSCRAATPCGRGCGCTTAASSSSPSTSHRLRRSAHALAFATIPADDEITERDPPDARRERHARRRAHPADAHPRRQDHQRHGPTAEPGRPDAHRAGRAQAAGLRHGAASRWSPSSVRRPAPDCSTRRSTTTTCSQSILAKIEANVAGADDALMLDRRGFVAETNATHVFLVDTGEVLTPTTRACPEGITRADGARALRDRGSHLREATGRSRTSTTPTRSS